MGIRCTAGRVFRLLPFILKAIALKICLGLAIHHIVEITRDYRKNEVATVVKLHQNESVWLPDTAICAPLSFMTEDPNLILAAKRTLLHDPSFLSKALHLDNGTAAQKYWDWKTGNNRSSLNAQELIESFVNDTLKPFLKNNISFPEENPVDTMMAQQAEVFDIVETASGSLVNKTILLASVALIDVITGYGQGRQSASSLLAAATSDLREDELDLVATMARELLKNPVIADQFSLNVARTLCEIFSPEWKGNFGDGMNSIDMCGIISKSPYYISLNQFCFNVPVSSTPFTKSNPSASFSLTLPLAQTIFSFGPLSQLLNQTTVNITSRLTSSPESPNSQFPTILNISNEESNDSIASSDPGDSAGASSLFNFNLPFDIPHKDALNLTALFNDTDELQQKLQRQMDDLLHTDLLSLAFKFPIVKPRTVSVYFPNDLRYYESEDQTMDLGLLGLLGLAPPASAPILQAEDFYSKVFKYVIKPTELIEPEADAIFGVTESRTALESEGCSGDLSVATCLKKCILANTQNVCGCTPFGTHHLINATLGSKTFRFCQLEDQACVAQVKESDSSKLNVTTMDCKAKCHNVCSATKLKWREIKQRSSFANLAGSIDAMLHGQPTHWTWRLSCDSFDYVEYVEQKLITRNQFLAQIGGILGFYGAIFFFILFIMRLIKKLIKCCWRKRNDSYDVYPIIVKTDSSDLDFNRPTVMNGDLKRAIEDAVRAEIMKLKYPEKIAMNGTMEKAPYQTSMNTPIENKMFRSDSQANDPYISHLMIGSDEK